MPVAAYRRHQVDFICCFHGKATDAMARHQFFHGTPLLLLLVDCSSFLHPEAVGCGSQLIVFVVFVVRQQAITTMAIAACCNQVDCAVFYLMEGHCYHGPVSFAPGSMKFGEHHLQGTLWFFGQGNRRILVPWPN